MKTVHPEKGVNDKEDENLCVLLIQLYNFIEQQKKVPDSTQTKYDLCDSMNTRVSNIIKRVLCTPYTTNFHLPIGTEPGEATATPDLCADVCGGVDANLKRHKP